MDLLMDIDGVNENACWTLPENFDVPLVTFIDEAQEEHIFEILFLYFVCSGHEDLHLRSIELHSNTLIQLERWFTASGQTRVTVVGPLRAKRWLMDMIRSVGSQQAYHQARGEKMLHHVQNQTLSTADLDDSFSMPAYIFEMIKHQKKLHYNKRAIFTMLLQTSMHLDADITQHSDWNLETCTAAWRKNVDLIMVGVKLH
ncbi:putative KHDC1-like protein [Peromyscus leucopus]|uniref:putative KHDC1-like protein n=1 Tax=Peromyscus leucopus TaxID=10041 RepID=UPI00188552A0|nr:putative KHDC1-like protein [Peromyscus leucopus]